MNWIGWSMNKHDIVVKSHHEFCKEKLWGVDILEGIFFFEEIGKHMYNGGLVWCSKGVKQDLYFV